MNTQYIVKTLLFPIEMKMKCRVVTCWINRLYWYYFELITVAMADSEEFQQWVTWAVVVADQGATEVVVVADLAVIQVVVTRFVVTQVMVVVDQAVTGVVLVEYLLQQTYYHH